MTLQPGTKIGPFEVLALLGVGGMGEVYRARDTRLKREVAIKVLPESVAREPDRTARFQREAEVLATLSHPNIASVHGLEESDGVTALVLELVEGPTLADRIALNPLDVPDAVAIARQIADALEAAHAAGIVHRDLKPANIKVRPDGTVKVLDFGLAKAFDSAPGASHANMTASPTITTPAMTMAGVILGTASYMAPEQARGKPVDKRADIWAFGCVLYEMLTGHRAFGGDEVSDTLAAVLAKDIDWNRLPASLPKPIHRVLRRCLEKDRTKRLADIADARLDLDEALSPEAISTVPSSLAPVRRRPWLAVAAGVAGIAAGALLMFFTGPKPPIAPTPPIYRASLLMPPNAFTASGNIPAPLSISPDGKSLVFVASDETGRNQLWLQRLDSGEPRLLAAPDGAGSIFWSPDSRQIGFLGNGRVMRMDLGGGPPVLICAAPNAGSGGAWMPDGTVLIGANAGTSHGLRACPASGSTTSTELTALDTANSEAAHSYPSVLPDGRHFLYSAYAPNATVGIYVSEIGSRDRRLILSGGSNALYASGYLLYMLGDTLTAHPFDPQTQQLTGMPRPLAERVRVGGTSGQTGAFSVSNNGVLVYTTGSQTAPSQLEFVGRDGKSLGAIGEAATWVNPRLSPDDHFIAVEKLSDSLPRNRDIWVVDARRGSSTRLTTEPGSDSSPVWSTDGQKIIYSASQPQTALVRRPAFTATTDVEVLMTNETAITPSDILPGDTGIFSIKLSRIPSPMTYLLSMSDRKFTPLSEAAETLVQTRIAPDGKTVAFVSNISGRFEVYVQEFPSAERRQRVSLAGGAQPVWRRDGKELFFLGPDGALMAVAIDRSPQLTPGTPSRLFMTRIEARGNVGPNNNHQYDVTKDGRFLINSLLEGATATPVTLVVNWPALLSRADH